MLIYLDQALNEVRRRRLIQALALSRADVRRAITTGAVKRLGPKMMRLIAYRHGCGRQQQFLKSWATAWVAM
jgi:copper/silver efflux system protein